MEKKVINQKEYLKKYLSSGDVEDKKKKKKKMKLGQRTVKVIDDDLDLKNMRPMEENEFDIFIDAEDAPQIAGVVDERGPVDFSDKRRWKIMADDDGGDITVTSVNKEVRQSRKTRDESDNDISPPRKRKRHSDDDLSPPRASKKQKKPRRDEDSDLSPPRMKKKKQSDSEDSQLNIPKHKTEKKAKRKEKVSSADSDLSSPRRKKQYDSDLSPPRKSKKHKSEKHKEKNDSDLSPPRRRRKESDSDLSPPRKSRKNVDTDLSPPKKNKNYDSDLSPPRKSNKHRSKQWDSDSDLSPPRRKRHTDSDAKRNNLSPPRQHKHRDERPDRNKSHKYSERNGSRNYESNTSPSRRKNRDDTSSNRFKENDRNSHKSKSSRHDRRDHDYKHRSHRDDSRYEERKSRWRVSDEEDNDKRMKKTLDGKTAGLQNATALREETEAYKKREAEHFSKLSKEVTGVGQAAVVRDTKTGRKRNLEAEAAEEREKQKRQEELDEKYAKWGTGLKQVGDREEKLKDDLYEMSKPLARYADDADLDKRLREQDREGDPMLEYIKQKQIKEGKRKPDAPKYEGSFMPNRFGIKPGHRWDGVDRSNGYEKRWFEAQNAKLARQEEAYKWSTSDM